MSRGISFCAAFALLCVSLCASAGEPRVGRYVKYDAGDYVIVSSRGPVQAKRFMEDLAKFRVTLERMLGKRSVKNTTPTLIVISSSADWNLWLAPRSNVAGWFQSSRFKNFMSMNGDAPLEFARQVMFHEYTHYYLASQFSGEYPPWFNEGLAELMGSVKFIEGGRAIVRIIPNHMDEARDRDWIPFERLINVSRRDPEYVTHQLAEAFYAQSWLTVHYGMIDNRDFGKQIVNYINQLNTLVPQDEALKKVFGSDLSVYDKQLRDYARQSEHSSGVLNIGELPAPVIAEGKPLDPVDAIAILADMMLETGRAPERIRPLVESLERRDPNKARAAILAARLAQRVDDNAGFNAAVTKAEAALAPDDWEQRRELAGVLLDNGLNRSAMSSRKSEETDQDLKRAMKWYADAVPRNNQDVETLWGFGATAIQLDQNLDLAEMALVAAYKLQPTNAEIAMSLANLKGRQQKPEEMIPYLSDARRYATNRETMRWATDTLTQMEEWAAEKAKVDAENRKRREEYEKQLAEYEKRHGKPKKK